MGEAISQGIIGEKNKEGADQDKGSYCYRPG